MNYCIVLIVLIGILQQIKGDLQSPCPKVFLFEPNKSEDDRWYGIITLSTQIGLKGITLELEFDKSLIQLGNWLGQVTSDDDNLIFTITNKNREIKPSDVYKVEIYAVYDPYYDVEPPKLLKIKLNGRELCPNYQQEVINTSTSIADDFKRPTLWVNISTPCGTTIATSIELITEGQYSKPGQYPWHAALYVKNGNNKGYICGGSLITERHVLTAAHCATINNEPRDPRDLEIILGKHGLWVQGRNEQTFQISKIKVHELFNRSIFYSDISILYLDRPSEYTKFVRPICLWEGDTSVVTVVGRTGLVPGWGRDHRNYSATDLLMHAEMPVIDTLACIRSYPEFYGTFANEKTFCAGYKNGTSVCNGDSGGGLVFPKFEVSGRNTVWYLRGIVSNTVAKINVCDPYQYTIFADVAQHLDWISKNIQS